MPSNRRSNKKGKPARDPSAYATVSIQSRTSAAVVEKTPPPSVAEAASTDTEAVTTITDEIASEGPPNPLWLSLDLAQRQAATRLKLELSLKDRMTQASAPTIQLSPQIENTIISHLRNGTLSMPQPPIMDNGEREWTRSANFVYETLVQYRFATSDVEQAMMAARGSGDIIDALTWLCINIPTERLPVDMRDKHEFVESKKKKEETVPTPAVVSRARIDDQDATNDDDGLCVDLADLGLGDSSDSSDDDDDDPSTRHARYVLQLRAYEEWVEYLQANNGGNRHSVRIRGLRKRITKAKRALTGLESDPLFIGSRSISLCEQLWAEYHDAVLDDMRRFKEKDMLTPQAVVVVDEKPRVVRDKADDAASNSDTESVLGFGEAIFDMEEEEEEEEASTVQLRGPQVVTISHMPRGWTGAAVRDIVLGFVHGIDRQASIKYQALRSTYGYTGTVTVHWSHPSKMHESQRTIPHAVTTVRSSQDAVTQVWTVPSDVVVGATARDARDLAALVYLYTQAAGSSQVLAPNLASLWTQWDAQHAAEEREARDQAAADRAEFLGRLRKEYETAVAAQSDRAGTVDHGPAVTSPHRGHTSSLRARIWGGRTIGDRQRGASWTQKFGAVRERLPARQFHSQITEALASHRVCVVRGETGSGKSSQIPQYALAQMLGGDYGGERVMCTQPRRISAMTIASRVSQELGDSGVGVAGSLVGYQIRFNARVAESNALVFCTTGVLLRMAAGDPDLNGITCIICDEVQERTLELDFLLILLRRLLERRSDLRLVLMSATIDTSAFACYFDSCPVVDIPGRAFPVTSLYLPRLVQMSEYVLERHSRYAANDDDSIGVGYGFYRHMGTRDPDYVSPVAQATVDRMRSDVVNTDLIHHLLRSMSPGIKEGDTPWDRFCVEHLPPAGSVLVFLPGIAEIRRLLHALHYDASVAEWAVVVPLHSMFANDCAAPGVSTATFTDVAFAPVAPGCRKIVLATNVAETGITIPDVTVVVDCGVSNQVHWDHRRRVTALSTRTVSRANVRQRAGRAGRVQAGLALCLFTEPQLAAMAEFELPEMQRLPLAALCLQAKAHGVRDAMQFLQLALDPPPQSAVAHALAELQASGALDENEMLTPIGRHLCALPVDLHVAKLLVAASLFNCLDPALTLAAALSATSSIVPTTGVHRRFPEKFLPYVEKQSALSSDFLATLAVYEDWRTHATTMTHAELRDWTRRNGMNRDALDAMEDSREQYLRLLHEQGLVETNATIRPPTRGLRQGLVVVPPEFSRNSCCLNVLYAALTMAFDHVVMPAMPSGHIIAHSHVTKRVEGIGHAIQIVDHERIATRPLDIERKSLVHSHKPLGAHALVAARLSSSGANATAAHDITCVSLVHVVLFARSLAYWPKARQLSVNRWIDAKCYARSAVVLLVLRRMIEEIVEFRVTSTATQPLSKHLAKWQDAIVDVLKTV